MMQAWPALARVVPSLRRALPAAMALLALALAWQGQRYFNVFDPTTFRPAMLRFGLAGASLALARSASLSFTEPFALPRLRGNVAPTLHWRWAMTLLGVVVAGAVLLNLSRPMFEPRGSYLPHLLGWVAATLLVAVPWLFPVPAGWKESSRLWLRAHRWEVVALVAITALAAWLRLADLATLPAVISGDEGSFGLEAQRVLSGDLRNPFALIYGPVPSLAAFVLALPATLFGLSIGSLRLVGALFGTLAVPALYALARTFARRRVAVVAALLLATFPMHLHYSRVALNVVWDTFFFTGSLAAFWWGMRRDRSAVWPFVVAGLLGGWGQYAYTGSRLLPILLVSILVTLTLLDRERLRGKGVPLLVMGLVFGVVAGPIYLYAAQHPDNFNARINQTGILQNGWLDDAVVLRGESRAAVLWDQFRRALFGFAFFPDQTASWGPGSPLAPPLLSLALFLGLIISLRRWRAPETWLLHGWFWAIVLAAGMLTVNPPTSNRMVGITPVVCLFAALGWDALARMLARARAGERQRWLSLGLLAFLTGLTLLAGLRAHEAYLAANRFGGTEAMIATRVGRTLAEQPPETTLVMLGAPYIYSDISPLAFLTPGYARLDVVEPLVAPPTNLETGKPLLFIILAGRMAEMPFVLQAFPDADVQEVRAADNGELLYYQLMVTGER